MWPLYLKTQIEEAMYGYFQLILWQGVGPVKWNHQNRITWIKAKLNTHNTHDTMAMGYFDFSDFSGWRINAGKERLMSGDSDPDVLPLREPGVHPFSAFTPGFPQQDQSSNWFPACCEWPGLTGCWRAATLSAAQTRFPLPHFSLPTLMCLKHSHIVFLQIWVKMTLGSYTIPKVDVLKNQIVS